MGTPAIDREAILKALQLAADGTSLEDAGYKVGLKYQTFRSQLRAFYSEIGATNIHHAIAILIRKGWIK